MEQPLASLTDIYRIYLEHPSVVIDSRKAAAGCLFFALRGNTNGNRYAANALAAGAAYALIDDTGFMVEGDDRYLLVADTLQTLQELAKHHRREFRMPVLGITGSNGKTTTKELVTAVMSRQYKVHATPGNYNNHIGLPLTILSMPSGTELLILEMGANHVGEIAELCEIGRPTHGIVTNIGEAHLEGFGGKQGIIRGKGELYEFLRKTGGVAFVNSDEEHLPVMAQHVKRTIPYMSSEEPSLLVPGLEIKTLATHPQVEVMFLVAGEPFTAKTQLTGRHNLQNIKTAIAVGKYFKVAGSEIAAALAAYQSENHRSQWLTHRNVSFYWDAYNANPSSVLASMEAFSTSHSPGDSVIILGEMLELGVESPVAHRRVVLRAGQVARTVLLVGDEMKAVGLELGRPHFADVDALSGWFWQQEWSGKKVFVKGSRGNKLERLIA